MPVRRLSKGASGNKATSQPSIRTPFEKVLRLRRILGFGVPFQTVGEYGRLLLCKKQEASPSNGFVAFGSNGFGSHLASTRLVDLGACGSLEDEKIWGANCNIPSTCLRNKIGSVPPQRAVFCLWVPLTQLLLSKQGPSAGAAHSGEYHGHVALHSALGQFFGAGGRQNLKVVSRNGRLPPNVGRGGQVGFSLELNRLV